MNRLLLIELRGEHDFCKLCFIILIKIIYAVLFFFVSTYWRLSPILSFEAPYFDPLALLAKSLVKLLPTQQGKLLNTNGWNIIAK